MPLDANLILPVPLAIAIMVGCVTLTAVLVRALDRGQRRDSQRDLDDLTRMFSAAIGERVATDDVRRAVDRTSSGTFWSALERFSLRLRYVPWLRLSRVLDGNRHARAERRALRDESPWRRVLAARRLGLLRSDSSRRALRRALVRGPELVALHAVLALGRARDRGALRWLLRHPESLAHRSPATLVGALRAFGPGALPDLATALERGLDSQRLERAIIEVLGLGGEHAARAALENRLTSGDLDLRVSAVRALGRIQAIESASALLAALEDDAWQVRAQAARALGEIGVAIAIPALAARLTDTSWWVRRHSAYALRRLGHEGQIALQRVVETSPDAYAREMADEALAGSWAPSVVGRLTQPRLRRRRA